MVDFEQWLKGALGSEGRRRLWAYRVAVMAVAAAVVLSIVMYRFGYIRSDDETMYNHSYLLDVYTNTSAEYVIRCPIPIDAEGGTYAGFLDELVVSSGHATTSIVEAECGKMLEVTAAENVTLEWIAHWEADDGRFYLNLSATTGDVYDYSLQNRTAWVYSSSSEPNIALQYSAEGTSYAAPGYLSGGGPYFYLMGKDGGLCFEPCIGWQQAPLEYGWTLID